MEGLNMDIKSFVAAQSWRFANKMPKWPHWYIVRKDVDEMSFLEFVRIIRKEGYKGKFYDKEIVYYDLDEYTYWTMGAPIEETIIINRALKKDTYEERLKRGDLPKRETLPK
jgi:hypothetical protein